MFLEGMTFSRDFVFLTPVLNYVNIICDLVFCLLVTAQFAKKNEERNERESGEEKYGTQEVADAQIADLIIIPCKLDKYFFFKYVCIYFKPY